ncbi:AAA family ATPase [Sphingobacterium sp. LRF_L2]|uniref:AAA family ATPase n=1 Tax=Sphingobacterium sp. LRF_L2 TaxID=3369421 RepID=UPI003F638EB4
MKIIIKSLLIKNFKGIKEQAIKFEELVTNIFGDNATGKTTVFDAFMWLFFGKESTDRKDFNIKNTVDVSLNRQDHEVEATIIADGSELVIKRIYREKWTKKRGAEEATREGNEQAFFWDGVPVSLSEFSKRVSKLIDEKVFKLISNPAYFNDLPWKEKREILFDMAGDVSDHDVAGSDAKFQALLASLTNGKTLEDFKKQIAAQRKKMKDELATIPVKISEVHNNMPVIDGDAALIRRDIETKQAEIRGLDQMMLDRNKAVESQQELIREHQNLIFSTQQDIDAIVRESKSQLNNADSERQSARAHIVRELTSNQESLKQIESQHDRRQNEIKRLTAEADEKREKWLSLNQQKDAESKRKLEFDDSCFSCPTCARLFDADDIEAKKLELQQNFATNQTARVNRIGQEMVIIAESGKKIKEEIERLQGIEYLGEILQINSTVEVLKAKLEEFDNTQDKPVSFLEDLLETNEQYKLLTKALAELKESLPQSPQVDISDLQAKKVVLNDEIQLLQKELAKEEVITSNKERIKHLEIEEKRMVQELASLEGQEFTIESFIRKKIEEVEKRINGLFAYVTFKMFEVQENGGEKEVCETMAGGVPYSDLNNAGRINAGLDIINALSRYYKMWAPIFVDNAESITQLSEVNSQVIRLVVSEGDKKLRVA